MLPRSHVVLNGVRCTHQEHLVILEQRLSTLAAATARTTLDGPLPVVWRVDWRCTFKVLRRHPDGSLMVVIKAGKRGCPETMYVRRCRIVQSHKLRLEREG